MYVQDIHCLGCFCNFYCASVLLVNVVPHNSPSLPSPFSPDKSGIIPFVLNTIREGQEELYSLIFVGPSGVEGPGEGWGGLVISGIRFSERVGGEDIAFRGFDSLKEWRSLCAF